MKCRKCKKEIPDESAFCLHCGAKQNLTQNPKSRGNGTGSVFKLPNGTWRAVRIIGWTYDAEGKKHKQTRSKSGFHTKREALAALADISTERREPVSSFRQVYDAWEPTHQASKSTMDCYHAAYRWFSPVWGLAMGEITVDDLQACLDACPKGRRTQENMRTLAGLLYKYAIPRHYANLDMSQYLTIHAHSSGGGKAPLPDAALDALKAHADTVPGAEIVLCHCYLGFRPSELLALNVEAYNPDERAFVGGAKTEAGRNRTVTVPPVIQPYVNRLLSNKLPKAPVFSAPDGRRMNAKSYRELFYRVLEECGIENPVTVDSNGHARKTYTPHSCRHTFAMLTARTGGADTYAKRLTGHADVAMLEHYRNGVDYPGLRTITDKMV